jgi:hypothetical protein
MKKNKEKKQRKWKPSKYQMINDRGYVGDNEWFT